MHAAKHTLADAQPRLAPAASPTPLTGFTARPRHWRTRTLGSKCSGWPRAPGLPRTEGARTHSAITCRTLLAYRAGSCFSSSDGVYTGRNCAHRDAGYPHEHETLPSPHPPPPR